MKAIRERAALIDQSSFSKFEISGPGALQAMQKIAANDLSGPAGEAVYTQLCNERGGIEADVTIVHLADDLLYLITGSGFGVRDSNWVSRNLPDGIHLRDVTNRFATLNICGPHARDILQSVSDDDLSNAAFPFLAARHIEIGAATALAVRIGYVGELGYELYIEQEYAAHVYDTLKAAGAPFGIADAGYRAIDAARMEKGYLYGPATSRRIITPTRQGLASVWLSTRGIS